MADTYFGTKGKPKVPGSGRIKGTSNKNSVEVRKAIESVFQDAGGNAYLLKFAQENPQAFLTQIWVKILPVQVNASVGVNVDFSHILEQARNRAVSTLDSDTPSIAEKMPRNKLPKRLSRNSIV